MTLAPYMASFISDWTEGAVPNGAKSFLRFLIIQALERGMGVIPRIGLRRPGRSGRHGPTRSFSPQFCCKKGVDGRALSGILLPVYQLMRPGGPGEALRG